MFAVLAAGETPLACLLLALVLLLGGAAVTVAFDAGSSVFPASTRQALAQKSQQLNAPSSGQQYTTAGWSNRAATVLTPVHMDGVYTADRPFLWNSIDVGCRSTIIELPSTTSTTPQLWVHSPVGLDGPMVECLKKLGTVTHVCTPNYEHTKFAAAWSLNYPEASMWGCPGLMERMPHVKWRGEIPSGYRPSGWQGTTTGTGTGTGTSTTTSTTNSDMWDTNLLQTLHINVERNPFTGAPFFNEVIFYHVPTKTLLTTDLFWNYPSRSGIPNSEFGRDDSWELAPAVDNVPLGSRLWKFGMDKVYYPFFNNLMVTDQREYKDICHHILNVWDVECVIPAHGDILRGKDFIRSVLTKYFQLDK